MSNIQTLIETLKNNKKQKQCIETTKDGLNMLNEMYNLDGDYPEIQAAINMLSPFFQSCDEVFTDVYEQTLSDLNDVL